MKKVSVIIPTYKKPDLTIRTIESVLHQTYNNIEIIVVDDGSPDDTEIRLKSLEDKIVYIKKTNGGASSARNLGIKKSTGQYIALLDCDDIYYPDKISESINCLENNEDCGFVYTGANYIDRNDDIITKQKLLNKSPCGWVFPELIKRNFICNSTVVARKECFDKVGLFDESIFICADWEMWLRISRKYKASYIEKELTGYRLTDSYTSANMDAAINEISYLLAKLSRENKIPQKLQKQCLSNALFSFGLDYAVMDNVKKARTTLIESLVRQPLKLKILFFYLSILLTPTLSKKLILSLRPNKQTLLD